MNLTKCASYLLAAVAAVQLTGCASTLSDSERHTLAGKTYVITGASSGIGRGTALQLAAMRANVVLAARRTDLLEDVAARSRHAGGQALVVTADVGRPEDIIRLADAALARFGRVDVWINNAGVGAIGRFEEIPLEDHSRLIDINLKGVIYGSHAAIRQFKKQGYGTLLNIGSVESEVPLAYHASYSASKHAVAGLGRALNEELRLGGFPLINVATVMPYATDTPFFQNAANYSGGTLRMPAMDDAQKSIDAIIHTSLHPREAVGVGWKAKFARFSNWIAPDLSERVSANVTHRYQFETAPPAPPTSGNLHQPVPTGRTTDGGIRERMARENAAREGGR